MRILLIEEFDSAPVPQALQCENIAFDMVPPPEEDEPFVFPEGVYDAAILTASDLSYSRSAKTRRASGRSSARRARRSPFLSCFPIPRRATEHVCSMPVRIMCSRSRSSR